MKSYKVPSKTGDVRKLIIIWYIVICSYLTITAFDQYANVHIIYIKTEKAEV